MSESPEELEARIAAYIDGELSPAEAARLEVFLANTDPALAQQVISMIGDKHSLSSLPKAKAPNDLAARIMEQVERGSLLNDADQFSPPRRPWWQSRAAVAALLFLVFGSFTWFVLQGIHTTPTQWQTVVENNSPKSTAAPQPKLAATPPAPTTPIGSTTSDTTEIDGPLAAAKDASATHFKAPTSRAGETAIAAASAISAPAAPAPPPSAAPSVAETPAPTAIPAPASESVAAGTIASPPVESNDLLSTKQTNAATAPAPTLLALTADSPEDFTRLQTTLDSMAANSTSPSRRDVLLQPAKAFTDQAIGGRIAGGGGGAGGFAGQNAANENTNPVARANTPLRATQNEQSASPTVIPPQLDDAQAQRQLNTANFDRIPVTYRLSLRASQISELTQQFHVRPTTGTLSGDAKKDKAGATTQELEKSKNSLADPLVDCIITMTTPVPSTQSAPAK